ETIPNWQNYLTYQDILLKPFNSQLLLEKINTHLQSASPKSKTKKIQKLSGSKAYIYHNAFFTKENRATHNYSCFLA
ncbi:MAG: DUF3292 domain-containing protein, partial [Dolichospermum sp.]|nr:DUF3292 domain-containing protein [Dolichospermum sp.]